jgi:hypothetical protein
MGRTGKASFGLALQRANAAASQLRAGLALVVYNVSGNASSSTVWRRTGQIGHGSILQNGGFLWGLALSTFINSPRQVPCSGRSRVLTGYAQEARWAYSFPRSGAVLP